jgi:hypothetical protein
LVPTDAHEGSREDFLRRHGDEAREAAAGPGPARDRFLGALWPRLIDMRTLILAAEDVVRYGGPAAGIDGVSPAELDRTDIVTLARRLRAELVAERYRPAPDRNVEIPKGSGRGTRTLSLSVVADRVLQRAILLLIQPFIDPQFSPLSFGGRPGLSTADALVAAEKALLTTGHRVVAVADIEKAFDNVAHDELMTCVRGWLGASKFTGLLNQILTTGRSLGIRQGGALSMLLLNLLLHDHLDRPFASVHPGCKMIRWVDDLLVIAPDRAEADRALGTVARLLDEVGGMALKDGVCVKDLHLGEHIEWLGLVLDMNKDALTMSVPDSRLTDLDRLLEEAHKEDCPTQHAQDVMCGVINALGPATPDPKVIDRIRNALRAKELDGAATQAEMMEWWGVAHNRYMQRRNNEQKESNELRHDADGTGEPTAPPVGHFAFIVPNAVTDAAHPSTHDRIEQPVLDDSENRIGNGSVDLNKTPTNTTGRVVRIALRRSVLGSSEEASYTGDVPGTFLVREIPVGARRTGRLPRQRRGARAPPRPPPP